MKRKMRNEYVSFVKRYLTENTKILNSEEWANILLTVEKYCGRDNLDEIDEKNALREISSIVYDILTLLNADKQEYYKQSKEERDRLQDEYENTITNALKKEFNGTVVQFVQGDNWSSFNFKDKEKVDKEHSYKSYFTIKDKNDLEGFKKILQTFIHNLARKPGLPFSIKYPEMHYNFINHADTIVLHYKEKTIRDRISDIAKTMKEKFADRAERMRTEHGVDIHKKGEAKGKSDSQLVSDKFAENVKNNKKALKWYVENDKKKLSELLLKMLKEIVEKASHRNVKD